MRGFSSWPLLLVGALFFVVPASWAQDEEKVPPEEETPKAEEERLPDQGPGEGEKVGPSSGGRTEAQEEHTVIPGDTLWDLCSKFLNNPWYWPRVWSYNPEITNPHWIFPGQKVRFYPSGELPSAMEAEAEFEAPTPAPEYEEPEVGPEDYVQFASGKDIIRAKGVTSVTLERDVFITEQEFGDLGEIVGSREDREQFSEYDPVYIEFNNAEAAKVGQQYMIIRTVRKIYHPITGGFVGYFTQVLGAGQVLSLNGNLATAVISASLDAILRGDRVAPWMPEMSKPITPKPNRVELRGYILDSRVTLTHLGERHVVFIDQGTESGVEEGNVFDVVRREDGFVPLGESREMDEWDETLPVEIFGRVLIMDARPKASTGLVMASLRELKVGDRVLMSVQ